MAPTGRCRRVVPIPRNSIENNLQKIVKKFERDATVGSIETILLNRYSGLGGGRARTARRRRVVPILFQPELWSFKWNGPDRTLSACRTDSTQLYRKSLRKIMKTFERDATVGSIEMVLLNRYSSLVGGMARTARRRCVVPIPRNSIEKASSKS